MPEKIYAAIWPILEITPLKAFFSLAKAVLWTKAQSLALHLKTQEIDEKIAVA